MGISLRLLSILMGSDEKTILNAKAEIKQKLGFKKISSLQEKDYVLAEMIKEIGMYVDYEETFWNSKTPCEIIATLLEAHINDNDKKFMYIFNRVMVEYYGMKFGDAHSLAEAIFRITNDIANIIIKNEDIVKNELISCSKYEEGNKGKNSFFINRDEWIYYCQNEKIIYKIKIDGSQKIKLFESNSEWKIRDINVIGDRIIFINWKPSHDTPPKIIFYKMKIDGTEVIKLKECIGNITMQVVGNWIYYSVGEYSTGNRFDVYKIRTDGKKHTKIDLATGMGMKFVSGDWIYSHVFQPKEDENAFYKIRTDGSEKVKLIDFKEYEMYEDISMVGDWIYCIFYYSSYSGRDNNEAGIYKMKIDGSEKTKLVSKEHSFGCDGIRVAEDWIYYVDTYRKDDDFYYSAMFKIKIDGSNKTMIIEKKSKFFYRIRNIDIFGDWIYYSYYPEIYRIKKDGSEDSKI